MKYSTPHKEENVIVLNDSLLYNLPQKDADNPSIEYNNGIVSITDNGNYLGTAPDRIEYRINSGE